MYRHRTSRFRILRPADATPGRWNRLQQRSGLLLLVLAGLVTAGLLLLAPRIYRREVVDQARSVFENAHWADFEAVERRWKSLPILQSVQTGREPDVQRFLADQPLVVALLDRFEGRKLWVREGDHLVEPTQSTETQLYLGWCAHAEMARRFEWNPSKPMDPDFGKVATVVLLSDRWLVIKRWRPGTPAVERELSLALGPNPTIRVGILQESDFDRWQELTPQAWGRDPLLQADPYRLTRAGLVFNAKTNAFGEGWNMAGIAFDPAERAFRRDLKRRVVVSYVVSALVGIAIGLGLYLRYRARRKAVLDADRMAAMTHSLKTPLAILKFRCDSLRLGRLSPERADEELLKIGEEVDHLTTLIENGLRVVRGGGASGPSGLVTAAWIQSILDDLVPGFELERRTLDLRLCDDPGRAPLSSLQSALLTLVENALSHGKGTVMVETLRSRRKLLIRVTDEGEGLEPHQVKALGKPFQRMRAQGKEGFLREGQGLGLSLLVQVAEQEGWGLSFASAPGRGFEALLEIPAARPSDLRPPKPKAAKLRS